jgi:polysaccharide biosynthesis protein PslG
MRLATYMALVIALACLFAAPAPAMPPREIAAVALHPWQMADPVTLERTFAGIAATGTRRARVDLRWCVIAPDGPDRADWSEMDAIVAAARRHGIELLPILGSVPAWAGGGGAYWAYPEPGAFEDFFAAALRRYPDIAAWEVWNEPNNATFSQPGPDPARFVELLRSARRARDRVGSRAKLIAGGVAPAGVYGPVEWVDEVARRSGLSLVDGLGVHPYSAQEPDDPGAWMMRLEALHDHLAALGRPDLPLWLTEYGAPSMPVASGYGPPLTEWQQARRLRLAFALASRWPWVANLTWYEYRDGCSDPANAECNFGLVHHDLTPKPAYAALREVVAGETVRLRPRLVLHTPKRRRLVRGTLLLPGWRSPTTRIVLRIPGARGRGRRIVVRVDRGVFSARVVPRGARARVVRVRYPGSRRYEPVSGLVRLPGISPARRTRAAGRRR